jgi:hypothetical protein
MNVSADVFETTGSGSSSTDIDDEVNAVCGGSAITDRDDTASSSADGAVTAIGDLFETGGWSGASGSPPVSASSSAGSCADGPCVSGDSDSPADTESSSVGSAGSAVSVDASSSPELSSGAEGFESSDDVDGPAGDDSLDDSLDESVEGSAPAIHGVVTAAAYPISTSPTTPIWGAEAGIGLG